MTKYVNTKLSNFPAKVRKEFVDEHGQERVQVEFAHHVFGSMGISITSESTEEVPNEDYPLSMDNRFNVTQTLFAMMRILEAYESLIDESRQVVELCKELSHMLPDLPQELEEKLEDLPEFDDEDELEKFFSTRYDAVHDALVVLGVKTSSEG